MFDFDDRLQEVITVGLTNSKGIKERSINPSAALHAKTLLQYLSDNNYPEPHIYPSVEDGGLLITWLDNQRAIIIEVKSNIIEVDCWTKNNDNNNWSNNLFKIEELSNIRIVLDQWI